MPWLSLVLVLIFGSGVPPLEGLAYLGVAIVLTLGPIAFAYLATAVASVIAVGFVLVIGP